VPVYYDREERFAGQPKQTVRRLFRYALDGIFSFSYKPLRLSLALGTLSAVFALLFATILVVCRLFSIGLFGEPMVVGYTSIIVSVLFLGGIQLFCVGLVGEYIGRIYDEVKRRPLYVVHRTRSRRIKSMAAARGSSGTH
jgi:dolichol-phosphate mannosyltransferase